MLQGDRDADGECPGGLVEEAAFESNQNGKEVGAVVLEDFSQWQEPERGINLACSRDKKKGPSGWGCEWGVEGLRSERAGKP